MSGQTDRHILLNYLNLWNRRTHPAEEGDPKAMLDQYLKRELSDELAHPRVRKTRYEKFYLGIKRVMASDLADHEKAELLQAYLDQMEEV